VRVIAPDPFVVGGGVEVEVVESKRFEVCDRHYEVPI
jgi:hypothetical protein